MGVLLFLCIFWVIPIVLAERIARGKNRTGWAWGLLLSWLGVLIVAVLPPRAGRHGDLGDVIAFRPDLVMGAIGPGATYGLRRSDGAVLRRWGGNDPWAEVTDPLEQEDVLAAMRRPFAMKMAWQQLERGHTKLALDQAANALEEAYDAEMLEDLAAFAEAVRRRGGADGNIRRANELDDDVRRAQAVMAGQEPRPVL